MTATAALLSVPPSDPEVDVTVEVTWLPGDPIGLTDVVIVPDPQDAACVLALLDTAITRLISYRVAYHAAQCADSRAPRPLPVPWHGITL